MKYSELVNKIVVDKDGKKIGRIVRIDTLSSMDREEAVFLAIIHIQRIIKSQYFPMPLNAPILTRIQHNTLRLDMTKKEFMEIVKQYNAERKIKVKTADLAKASDHDKAIALSAWTRF
ncbi:MAG: hypothetical protein FK732_10090 [Asgard group archaeon]|nr:hypothetical protein [Asgard group archaeon]